MYFRIHLCRGLTKSPGHGFSPFRAPIGFDKGEADSTTADCRDSIQKVRTMAKEHHKIAKRIPGTVIRCGPRTMLFHVCKHCGDGKPFKRGKSTVTLPAGRYQMFDTEMMKVLGTTRRTTIRENRQTMLEACQGAVTLTYEFKQGCRYPVIVYHVDIEKLEALATKSVHPSCTENVHPKRTESVQPETKGCTESGAHTGDVHLMGRVASPRTGEVATSGVGSADADERRCAALRSDPPAHSSPQTGESYLEVSVRNCLKDLSASGYETNPSPDTVKRITSRLEADGATQAYSVSYLFEYIAKAKWLLNKTQGRLDWLADRIVSEKPRCLLDQFRDYLVRNPQTYLQGEVDPEELDDTPAADSPAARGKAFAMLDICEPNCKLPKNHAGDCYMLEPEEV